jgi:hypothetical protein
MESNYSSKKKNNENCRSILCSKTNCTGTKPDVCTLGNYRVKPKRGTDTPVYPHERIVAQSNI